MSVQHLFRSFLSHRFWPVAPAGFLWGMPRRWGGRSQTIQACNRRSLWGLGGWVLTVALHVTNGSVRGVRRGPDNWHFLENYPHMGILANILHPLARDRGRCVH